LSTTYYNLFKPQYDRHEIDELRLQQEVDKGRLTSDEMHKMIYIRQREEYRTGVIDESVLDQYVTNGYLSAQEKIDIMNYVAPTSTSPSVS
jgi:hypothetical protein